MFYVVVKIEDFVQQISYPPSWIGQKQKLPQTITPHVEFSTRGYLFVLSHKDAYFTSFIYL